MSLYRTLLADRATRSGQRRQLRVQRKGRLTKEQSVADFNRVDLGGSRFELVDLRGAQLRAVDLPAPVSVLSI